MKIRWGIHKGRELSGAGLYVLILQISSLLPLLYILVASGYTRILEEKNALSYLFETGIMALPRIETLVLSFIYRLTTKEVIVYFAFPAIALVLGIVAGKLFRKPYETAKRARFVFAVLIAADLVLRALPVGNYGSFSLPAAVIGTVIRAVCLVLLLLDIRTDRKEKTALWRA